MKFLNIYLYALTNAGHYELVHTIMEFAMQCEGVTTNLSSWLTPFKEAVEEEERVMAVSLKNVISAQLRKLDAQRDGIVSGIKGCCNAMLKSLDYSTVEAAESVMVQLDSLKVELRENYINQTGQIDTLVSVLMGKERDNVVKLGLMPMVEELKKANDLMHQLMNERDLEQLPRTNDGLAAVRKATDAAYDNFMRSAESYVFLNAAALADNDQGFNLFFDKCNAKLEYVRRHNLKLNGVPDGSTDGELFEPEEEEEGTTTPGEGEGGTTAPGEGEGGTTTPGEEETKPVKYTITWVNNQGTTVKTMQVDEGGSVSSSDYPSNTSSSYYWSPRYYSSEMSNVTHDVTVRELRQEYGGDGVRK